MDEHGEAAEGAEAAGGGGAKEGGLEGGIHDVDDEETGGGAVEGEGDAGWVGPAVHAEGGAVHEAIVGG